MFGYADSKHDRSFRFLLVKLFPLGKTDKVIRIRSSHNSVFHWLTRRTKAPALSSSTRASLRSHSLNASIPAKEISPKHRAYSPLSLRQIFLQGTFVRKSSTRNSRNSRYLLIIIIGIKQGLLPLKVMIIMSFKIGDILGTADSLIKCGMRSDDNEVRDNCFGIADILIRFHKEKKRNVGIFRFIREVD